MEITVSKKDLMDGLRLFDLDNDPPKSINIKRSEICLKSIGKEVFINVLVLGYSTPHFFNHTDDQWSKLYLFLLKIEEQPVILTIEENVLKATFEF